MPEAKKLRGKAWVFGDFMDVDWEICPYDVIVQLRGRGIPTTQEEIGKYCMVNVDPDFPKKVERGDFIVAGENFGYGHDHDHACVSIMGAGVAAVICESTNTNFKRNSIHHGIPVIVCKGIKRKVKEGNILEINLGAGVIENITTNEQFRFIPFPDFLLRIIKAGGIYPHLEKQIQEGTM